MGKFTFGCEIGCEDGRTKIPVWRFLRSNFGITAPDQVAEPGIVKILAKKNDPDMIQWVRKKVAISVHHGSKVAVIVAHPDCAGNPVPDETQIKQLFEAKKTVEEFGFDLQIILLWVNSDFETVTYIDAE